MPSKRGIDQAMTWLKGKAAEKNTLDGVNAELCISVIMDLQRQYDRLGAQFNNLRNSRYKEEDEKEPKQMNFLDQVDIPKDSKPKGRT